jgi:hypothetical protein
VSYFEKEGAFRHLNELLFIMYKHRDHFCLNDELITQLLITVDGRGDERTRNKLTRFLMVLLKGLLNLDKVNVLSFAEGDSKLHSVYSSYRPVEAWRGPALNRFEIQPIIDVTRLPEYHYLPFSKAKNLVESLADNEFPMWLTVPDFFLPTKNLEFVHENKPDKVLKTKISYI